MVSHFRKLAEKVLRYFRKVSYELVAKDCPGARCVKPTTNKTHVWRAGPFLAIINRFLSNITFLFGFNWLAFFVFLLDLYLPKKSRFSNNFFTSCRMRSTFFSYNLCWSIINPNLFFVL